MATLLAILIGPLLLVAGCRAADRPIDAHSSASASATPSAESDPWLPDDGPQGVLAAIYTQHFADHDQLVFHFHGHTPPTATLRYADHITADPSDQPVSLLGNAFVAITFRDARLDTAAIESDPAKVVRYGGPIRLTPRYSILQELAVSGDFEAVLSFGLGLNAVADLRTSTPAGMGTVIVDLWPTSPTT